MATLHGHRLEVQSEKGAARHLLDGQGVEPGEVLELLVHDGQWVSGTYRCEGGVPALVVTLGGEWELWPDEEPVAVRIPLPPEALLRRPDWKTEPTWRNLSHGQGALPRFTTSLLPREPPAAPPSAIPETMGDTMGEPPPLGPERSPGREALVTGLLLLAVLLTALALLAG